MALQLSQKPLSITEIDETGSIIETLNFEGYESLWYFVKDAVITWGYSATLDIQKEILGNSKTFLEVWKSDGENFKIYYSEEEVSEEDFFVGEFPVGTPHEDVVNAAKDHWQKLADRQAKTTSEQLETLSPYIGATIVAFQPGRIVLEKDGQQFIVRHHHSVWDYGDASESWLIVDNNRVPN